MGFCESILSCRLNYWMGFNIGKLLMVLNRLVPVVSIVLLLWNLLLKSFKIVFSFKKWASTFSSTLELWAIICWKEDYFWELVSKWKERFLGHARPVVLFNVTGQWKVLQFGTKTMAVPVPIPWGKLVSFYCRHLTSKGNTENVCHVHWLEVVMPILKNQQVIQAYIWSQALTNTEIPVLY